MDLLWLLVILKLMFGMANYLKLSSSSSSSSFYSGIYSLLVVSSILDILTPELVEGTAEFIASCQTYEGGFASASYPCFPFSDNINNSSSPLRPTLGEAHGGYTFCALASWVLLQPYLTLSSPSSSSSLSMPSINLKNLLRWLTQMQGTEIELGGFKGRTNKLVDGCYSWWCGGCFALLEALGVKGGVQNIDPEQVSIDSIDGSWADIDGMYETCILMLTLRIYYLFSLSRRIVRSIGVTRIYSLCRSTSYRWPS